MLCSIVTKMHATIFAVNLHGNMLGLLLILDNLTLCNKGQGKFVNITRHITLIAGFC